MKQILIYFLVFSLLISNLSCSLFKSPPKITFEEKWKSLWGAACESSEGKGQIFLPGRTYAFSYESSYSKENSWWVIALEVPLRGEESLIVPLDKAQGFEGSLLSALDAKTKKKLTPEILMSWKRNWLTLIGFLNQRVEWSSSMLKKNQCSIGQVCKGAEGEVYWLFGEEKIELKIDDAKTKTNFTWSFKRRGDDFFFTEQVVTLRHQKNSQTISLHLYPESCLK